MGYPERITEVRSARAERTSVPELAPPKSARLDMTSRYAEIGQLVGHPPDVARLKESTTVDDQIVDQNAIAFGIKISSSVRIERALGSRWSEYVEGYTQASGGRKASVFSWTSEIKTIWKMTPGGQWYAVTGYPQP